MNNVHKMKKKELSTEIVNIKFTKKEKEYYKMAAVNNKKSMSELIRFCLKKEVGSPEDMVIGNLKEFNIKTG